VRHCFLLPLLAGWGLTRSIGAGSLVWSLRPHSARGGHKTHGEGDGIWSYRAFSDLLASDSLLAADSGVHRFRSPDIPGWKDPAHREFDAREASIVPHIRAASFKINGQRVPSRHPIPPAPSRPWVVQASRGGPAIAFQGAAWAHSYVVVVRGQGGEHTKEVKDHTKEGEFAVDVGREVQASGGQGVQVSVVAVSVDGARGGESEALTL